jgi:Tol biopolymer transport system component
MRKLLQLGLLTALASTLAVMPAAAKVAGLNGRILYGNNNGVFVANPDGSHNQLLEANTCCASWSPDGSLIALAGSPDGGVTISTATVHPDGSGYKLLPLPDATLNLGPASGDSWSPDGTRLALQGWDNTNSSRNGVYTASAIDGSGLVRVTSNPYGSYDVPGDYSPDGTRIVFYRQDPNRHDQYALFVVNANGGPVHQITPWEPNQDTASWSPDGHWILTDDGRGHLFIVHPDGSGRREIYLAVTHRNFAFTPSWSPDGKKIVFGLFVFTGPHTGQEAIYTANADGTDLQSTGLQGDTPDWGSNPIAP